MNAKKRKALRRAGFRLGGIEELLDLSDADLEVVEARLRLARAVRELRIEQQLTQKQLAERVGSSQPRVAAVERGNGTLEQLIRFMFALGADRKKVAKAIAAA
jgi:DNA-binding XRE family transcriptional regulator